MTTSNGVVLYDGFETLHLPAIPEKRFQNIHYLPGKDRMRIHNSNEIWSVDCKTLKAKKLLRVADPDIKIFSTYQQNQELFLALTSGNIYKITEDDQITLQIKAGVDVRFITGDEKGTLYFTHERFIYSSPKNSSEVNFLTTNKERVDYSGIWYANKKLIASTWYDGYFMLTLPGMQREPFPILDTGNNGRAQITAATVADSFIYLANTNYSLYKYNIYDKSIQELSKMHKDVFYGKQVRCIFVDHSVIWIGTNRGVIKMSVFPSRFTHMLSDRLPIVSTRSIVKDHDDFYVASYSGIYYKSGDKNWVNLTSGFKTPHTVFPRIMLNTDTGIYLGMETLFIFRLDKKEHQLDVIPIYSPKTVNAVVHAMTWSPDGKIWLGGALGIFSLDIATQKVKAYPSGVFDVNKETVRNLYYHSLRHHLYAATENGLFIFSDEGKLVKAINTENTEALSSNSFMYVTRGPGGMIWLCTRDDGIYLFDNHKLHKHITIADGLADNCVYGVLFDRHNRAWISTNNGLSRYDIARSSFYNYFTIDGLSSNEFNHNSQMEDDKGNFYFGGINAFQPDSFTLNTTDFKIFISSIKKWNKHGYETVLFTDSLKLIRRSSDYSISIMLGTSDYRWQEKTVFYYHIDGVTKGWVKMPPSTHFFIPEGLSYGTHDVKIKAINFRGAISSNTLYFQVELLPPFYYKWWFIGLIFGSVMLVFYLITRFRIREIKRYQDLRIKIASDLHDEVGGLLTGIGMYSDNLSSHNDLNDKAQQRIGKIADLSRQAISSMRDILWSIDARNDSTEALEEQVRRLAEELLTPLNIRLDI